MAASRSALILAALLLGAARAAAGASPEPVDPWKDPEFQKSFLGSYGVLGEVEPRVTAEERAALEKIIPMMSSDLAGAAAQLASLTTPSSSATLDFTLGNIYFQLDRLDEAAASYETAVRKFPSFLRAHRNLGLIYVRTGRMEQAVGSLGRTIELGAGDGLTFGLLGHAHAAREEFLSAESAYRQALMLQPESLDWKLGLTRCLFRQARYAEAASLCGELIARDPERADFWLLQANAYLGMKEPIKAAQNYEMVARMGAATVEILDALGDIYVNAGLTALAARAYLQAIEIDPGQDVAGPLRAAEILAARGAAGEVGQILRRITELFGERVSEQDRRRLLKIEARVGAAEGRGAEAAAALEKIVALDPLDGEALMLLAQHYAGAGDPERAIFYYERAASLEPFEVDAKLRLAQLLVNQARYQDALPLLRRAQELRPREEVARYLEQVERIARARR